MTQIAIERIECPMDLYPRAKFPGEKDVAHLHGVEVPAIVTAQVERDYGDETKAIATVLVDGAHRLVAAKLGGMKEIECEDLGLLEETEVLQEAIRRNRAHGKQLSLNDKAKLTKIYATEGWKIADIVDQLGIPDARCFIHGFRRDNIAIDHRLKIAFHTFGLRNVNTIGPQG